jgi:hypothetical protein
MDYAVPWPMDTQVSARDVLSQVSFASRPTCDIRGYTHLQGGRHVSGGYLGEGSRRAQKAALDLIASQLTGRVCDLDSMAWERLRYQHTAALRTWLMEPSLCGGHRQSSPGRPPRRASRCLAAGAGRRRVLPARCRPRGRGRNRVAGARDAALLAIGYGAGLRGPRSPDGASMIAATPMRE